MSYLLLDTNAVYDLVRRSDVAIGIVKLAKSRNFRIAVAPMVLVECVTKFYEDNEFGNNIIKPAFKKLKNLDAVVLADQDVLLESLSYGDVDLNNYEENWDKILNHLHESNREGENFVYTVKQGKRVIYGKFIRDSRQQWEERYKKDWLWMLEQQGVLNADSLPPTVYAAQTKAINKSFLQQSQWDDIFFKTMQERTGMDLTKKKNDVLELKKYESQEYNTIWNKVINDGYKPFSKSKKNDYNDISVMLYAGLKDVYVFSGDMNMVKKTNAHADGKLFVRDDVL